ncbi:MAG: phospho-N-acetylmuramoyl-pentapeptide-transferase [Acidimicrobiia bacterium]
MIGLLLAATAAFVLSVLGTPLLIRVLSTRGVGQTIRDDGPISHPHVTKEGTPTMGGVALVGAAVAGYLIAHVRTESVAFARSGIAVVGLVLGMAVIGFLDDVLGVLKRRNLGLRKRGKTTGMVLVSVGFALLALEWVDVSTDLSFTRSLDLQMGATLWCVWAVLMILGSSNAVNITDGLDGLAAGSATLVLSAFVIIAFWKFRHPDIYGIEPAQALDLAIVAAALVGACAGFLWWNAAPARIFMGDTGSLALGGALAGLALLLDVDLLLPILGGLYVIETLSVITQIVSFRLFGTRVFRMAPIHHHFEVGGWPEFTVIVRFWLIAGLFVALGVGIFYSDYINIPGSID